MWRRSILGAVNRPFVADGGGGGPTPALNLDLTSSLPASITFARSGTRNAIVSGALVSVSSGVPAFESWNGVNRGMAVEASASLGGITQALTYSNDTSNAAWVAQNTTRGTGGTGPDGVANSLTDYAETTANAVHAVRRRPGSQAAGARYTMSSVVKLKSGSVRWAVQLRMSNEFNNNGPQAYFMIDGTDGFYVIPDTAIATNATCGLQKLADDMYRIWITATWVSTGNKEYVIGGLLETASTLNIYTGVVTEGFQIYGMQISLGEAPCGWVTTTSAALTQPAETAVFNDITWFDSAEGTFIVEHDCATGPLIGSGANAVLTATVAGKTAIAWDAVDSDTVNNGGSAATGTTPTFGADIRLLGTNAVGNIGHIKSISYYATRLSVAEMQTLTAPTVTSTANPGALRSASIDNRLPSQRVAASGTQLNFASRFRLQLPDAALSSLKLDFANFYFGSETVGNALVIDAVYLERVTGVTESVQVLFGGLGAVTLADGDANILSDEISPASFTGLTEFPANAEFRVRVRGRVASAGQFFAVSRSITETAGAQAFMYDPATLTLTNFSGTGSLTSTGTGLTNFATRGPCPVMVGVYTSGDPKTVFIAGDSLIEGTGGSLLADGTYLRNSCRSLGVACIEFSQGGASQSTIALQTKWRGYVGYCRVYVDNFGTNNPTFLLHFLKIWNFSRATYAVDKIMHSGPYPRTSSTDSFATEVNQTITRAYPSSIDFMFVSTLGLGFLNSNSPANSVRGTNVQKWIVNGAALYATGDGTHQTSAGDLLLQAEWEPILDALTLT